MRDDPALLQPERFTIERTVQHNAMSVRLAIWDTIEETAEEILGSEDCYRLRELPKKMSVVDFGASVGTFTIGALLRGIGQVHVLAVEGDLASLIRLIHNVRGNWPDRTLPYHRFVHPVCAFVGDAGGQPLKRFFWKGPESLAPTLEVSTRLWDYLPSDRPRVIKMDIEESEIDLFRQPRFLAFVAMAQHFLLEFHAFDGYYYADQLGQLGYHVELTGCGNPAPPYNRTMARGMLYARK